MLRIVIECPIDQQQGSGRHSWIAPYWRPALYSAVGKLDNLVVPCENDEWLELLSKRRKFFASQEF
jgi:hypothetical protein